jgi:uncharacterized protein (TIGR03546 family)
MFSLVVKTLRSLTSALLSDDSPRQLAAGFALGMIIGLMPKGNLIAVSLCVLVFSLRVNASAAILAAVAFSWVGAILDPLSANLGARVLGIASMQATYASMFNLPLGPWLGFNNTAVMGSLLIGLYLAYPAYWISRTVSENARQHLLAATASRRRTNKGVAAKAASRRAA